ncbi:hypothetical protein QYF36_019666 [Acer negundo]|nr:hypothetical protein QYF36_019666 [Acer negundo]
MPWTGTKPPQRTDCGAKVALVAYHDHRLTGTPREANMKWEDPRAITFKQIQLGGFPNRTGSKTLKTQRTYYL